MTGRGFTIGQHIPIALLAAIFIQTCGIVWAAAMLTAKVNSLEEKIAQETVLRKGGSDKVGVIS
jgi:hypothetical protein